jgi:EAL domain-containing protein (putative c-di-GMP-specific phosphodiesterase class I)
MGRRAVERLDLQTDLERALESNEWRLVYQPIVHLETEAIVGAEALLRWQHPRRGLLTPIEFIGLAEETGLILAVGRWALSEACRQAVDWRTGQQDGLRFGVSVNLSGAAV